MLVGGNNHLIERTVIHDVVLETFDSGAIYSSDRDWTKRGNVFKYNLIYNVGSAAAFCNKLTACCRLCVLYAGLA